MGRVWDDASGSTTLSIVRRTHDDMGGSDVDDSADSKVGDLSAAGGTTSHAH